MFSDGYLRITSAALDRVSWRHVRSAIDLAAVAASETEAGAIAGYTEWQGCDVPNLSIGWDWIVLASGPTLIDGSVRSNLMLVDEVGRDAGPVVTASRVEGCLRNVAWQREVLNVIT